MEVEAMANEEHLRILRQGVEAWNKWRSENPHLRPSLSDTGFQEAELTGAVLTHADLISADLSRADLSRADFRRAELSLANLNGANLSSGNLSFADLRGAVLRDAVLRDAVLDLADLSRADLSGADLSGADLRSAILGYTDLSDAVLTDARIGWTRFADLDLSSVKGLDTVKHEGPSSIGIDTLYKSQGKIPESFLRGCGVPDTFIVFAKSLVGKAVDFYSCFISHSSNNFDFAERLHADLQNNAVRCWYAPEDLKIGDKFRQTIDEAIRIHDKLLIVLSADSISSDWVEDEVESALERERRENRLVLFPVRIDDAVMDTEKAWASSLRRMRHIGDFSRWKEHDSYRKAFDRLLRDLKAESNA
jgi:hypothetical protein